MATVHLIYPGIRNPVVGKVIEEECRLSEKDYAEVENVLGEPFVSIFRGKLVLLVLFGSYARREARYDSGIDVLVVVEDCVDRFEVHRLIDVVEGRLRKRLSRLASKGVNLLLSPHILLRSLAFGFRPPLHRYSVRCQNPLQP